MSKDIEKYTNWRAITESDYVTMFIKTWFAFVATFVYTKLKRALRKWRSGNKVCRL